MTGNPAWVERIAPFVLLALVSCCVVPGCSADQAKRPAPSPVNSASAERLHDISGALLLYYARSRQMPAHLELLAALGAPQPVVPDTGQPYVYLNPPIAIRGRPGNLLIHEPIGRNQSGGRTVWCVLVQTSSGGGALATQVIAIPTEDVRAATANIKP